MKAEAVARVIAPSRQVGTDDEAMVTSRTEHDRMANAVRALAMDAVEQAKSGHPGLPMGTADIATVLFTRFLKHDPPGTARCWSMRSSICSATRG